MIDKDKEKEEIMNEISEIINEDIEDFGEDKFKEYMSRCMLCCLDTMGDATCMGCKYYPAEKMSDDITTALWNAEVCAVTAMAVESLAEKEY